MWSEDMGCMGRRACWNDARVVYGAEQVSPVNPVPTTYTKWFLEIAVTVFRCYFQQLVGPLQHRAQEYTNTYAVWKVRRLLLHLGMWS